MVVMSAARQMMLLGAGPAVYASRGTSHARLISLCVSLTANNADRATVRTC